MENYKNNLMMVLQKLWDCKGYFKYFDTSIMAAKVLLASCTIAYSMIFVTLLYGMFNEMVKRELEAL